VGILASMCIVLAAAAALEAGTPPAPKRSTQYGHTRLDFDVPGGRGFIILPKEKRAEGQRPWVWYAPAIGAHPNANNGWMLSRLLAKGFAVCGCNVGESHGNPRGVRAYDAFYAHVVQHYGLAARACLLPQSRGGLMLYNWAATGRNAARVACIGGIYPVCDLASWPGLQGATRAYGMTVAELRKCLTDHNPIDRLAPIANARVPILHIHGDADRVVPLKANSAELARRYKALGGAMDVIVVPGKGHAEIPEFFHSQRLLDFFLTHGPAASH